MSYLLFQANAQRISLPSESIHCVVTSPPYWKQRKYVGGIDCLWKDGWFGELGRESTPGLYIEHLVDIFRETKRVLRPDGQMFLNISDKRLKSREWCNIPHLLVAALCDDGWRFEDEIIWEKPNAMPSPHGNRFVRSHEYVFLLNKSRKASLDMEAVKEPYTQPINRWGGTKLDADGESTWDAGTGQDTYRDRSLRPDPEGRRRRSVWSIPTRGYSYAHFACFPPSLVEVCIKAGTSDHVCAVCGAPFKRVMAKVGKFQRRWSTKNQEGSPYNKQDSYQNIYHQTGWRTTCDHPTVEAPATVFDPFAGTGTTLVVADRLGRIGIGADLSGEYLRIATDRINSDSWQPTETPERPSFLPEYLADLPLFVPLFVSNA